MASPLHLLLVVVFVIMLAVDSQQCNADTEIKNHHNQYQIADKRLLFASCNRQTRNQSHWSALKVLRPDAFLWVGDAVYAKDNSLDKLKLAYETLLQNTTYRDFAHSTKVVGTWDDHGGLASSSLSAITSKRQTD